MACLLDTSVVARLANASDAQHEVAMQTVLAWHRRGETLQITPQVLIEFRCVATRPTTANGLGLSSSATATLSATYEDRFPLLPETPAVYVAWKALINALEVTGKQVHDARLVAICQVHAVTHLMTFNVGHFARLVAHGRAVTIVNPADHAG